MEFDQEKPSVSRRKFLAVAAAGVSTLALAACGGGTSNQPAATSGAAGGAATAGEAGGEACDQERRRRPMSCQTIRPSPTASSVSSTWLSRAYGSPEPLESSSEAPPRRAHVHRG